MIAFVGWIMLFLFIYFLSHKYIFPGMCMLIQGYFDLEVKELYMSETFVISNNNTLSKTKICYLKNAAISKLYERDTGTNKSMIAMYHL